MLASDVVDQYASNIISRRWDTFRRFVFFRRCRCRHRLPLERKPTQLSPLAMRVSGYLQAVGFKKSDVITSAIPSTPLWLLTRAAVNFTLQYSDKSNTPPDLVQKFLNDYTVLTKNGKNIILCCIPSHVGILGNQKADAAAKSALSLPVTRMKLPATGTNTTPVSYIAHHMVRQLHQ